MILGPGAAGKSALAAWLGEITGLPVIELDKWFWRAGLAATSPDQWAAIQRELVQQEAWIMDGDLGPYDVPDVRLRAADTVIFLDFPRVRCAWRAVRRSRERRLLALAVELPPSQPPADPAGDHRLCRPRGPPRPRHTPRRQAVRRNGRPQGTAAACTAVALISSKRSSRQMRTSECCRSVSPSAEWSCTQKLGKLGMWTSG